MEVQASSCNLQHIQAPTSNLQLPSPSPSHASCVPTGCQTIVVNILTPSQGARLREVWRALAWHSNSMHDLEGTQIKLCRHTDARI